MLWGNVHFDSESQLAVSVDGRAYVVKNAQYAAALLEAVAGKLNVVLAPGDARARAEAILTRVLELVEGRPGRPPVHHEDDSPELAARRDVQSLVAVLSFLALNRGAIGVPSDVANRLGPIVETLLQAFPQEAVPLSRRRRDGEQPPLPRSGQEFAARIERVTGLPFHWAQFEPSSLDVLELDPTHLPPGGRPWPIPLHPCSIAPCERKDCHVAGYIPTSFFQSARKVPGRYPVILIGGWQVQWHAHTGGGGFGNESSFSTLPPAEAPAGNNSNEATPPPVVELRTSLPTYRSFYGLGTMLRCVAGYDYVTWGQSHPGGPIQISAHELALVVEATKNLYGVDKVILVGHSRGGLIARKYILDRWRTSQDIDVEKVITYGTPHLGAELANVGEDVIAAALLGVVLNLLDPVAGGFVAAEILELIGDLFGTQAKEAVEDQLIELSIPIIDQFWTNFDEFVHSGEQMRPDSPFLEDLNAGYASAEVDVKGQILSLWEAIPHVLVAGTSPDFLTVWIGSWLSEFTFAGLAEALEPHVGWTTINVFGAHIKVPWVYYHWQWTWQPLLRVMSDVAPLIPAFANLDTMKEGRGDAIVPRSSALAEGVVGPRRAEFALEHFNIKANTEQETTYPSPIGPWNVNPWQLLFLELGITDLISISSMCTGVEGCDDFNMTDALH